MQPRQNISFENKRCAFFPDYNWNTLQNKDTEKSLAFFLERFLFPVCMKSVRTAIFNGIWNKVRLIIKLLVKTFYSFKYAYKNLEINLIFTLRNITLRQTSIQSSLFIMCIWIVLTLFKHFLIYFYTQTLIYKA